MKYRLIELSEDDLRAIRDKDAIDQEIQDLEAELDYIKKDQIPQLRNRCNEIDDLLKEKRKGKQHGEDVLATKCYRQILKQVQKLDDL